MATNLLYKKTIGGLNEIDEHGSGMIASRVCEFLVIVNILEPSLHF